MNIYHHFYARLSSVFLIVTALAITGIYYYFEQRAATILHKLVAEETVWFDNATTGLNWEQEADRHKFMQAFQEIALHRGFLQMLITYTNREEIFYYCRGDNVQKLLPGVDLNAPANPGEMEYRLIHRDSDYQLLFSVYPSTIRGKGIVWGVLPMEDAFAEQIEGAALIAITVVLTTAVLIGITILPLVIRTYQTIELRWRELQRSYLATIQTLSRAIAKRDKRTNRHNFRVAYYSLRLGEKLGLPRDKLRSLILGALLHDIGKIGIPDHILLKPGQLNETERKVMQTHVPSGVEIIEDIEWLHQAKAVIGSHHERFDGNGYPAGLSGENISIEARVFAVVDVFDALTTERPYKPAFLLEDALAHLVKGSTTHFDPKVVDTFITIAPNLYKDVRQLSEQRLQMRLQKAAARHFPELTVI